SERGFSVPGGMLAAAGVGALFAGSYLYSQGLIRVSVHEKRPGGEHIRLAVPAAIAPLALAFVPAKEIGKHMPAEARQHLPVVEAALNELQRLPDCTLVQVDGPGEHVRIRVLDHQMVVDVNDHQDEVHLTMPLGSLRSVMAKLGRAAEYSSGENACDRSGAWGHAGHHGSGHPDGEVL
ncbi:MAG: hypothetical protein L0191_21535, partial [Acidobacteria bacterium]|nr:hypothetical protein [Acidobacteriota bacterium]